MPNTIAERILEVLVDSIASTEFTKGPVTLCRSTNQEWLTSRLADGLNGTHVDYRLPDGSNFASLTINTRRYGADVKLVEVSFWSSKLESPEQRRTYLAAIQAVFGIANEVEAILADAD